MNLKNKLMLFACVSFLLFSMNSFGQSTNEEFAEGIPFAIIDQVPVFPGCKGTNEDKKKCMNKGIQMYVAHYFNGNLASSLDLDKGKQYIYVQFKITKKGKIKIIASKAPHKALADEAERVVKLLPNMIPGEHDGKKCNVTYMLPITFNVD